jgi:hypothetical protein
MLCLKAKELPRGRVIKLFFDPDRVGRNPYSCAAYRDGKPHHFVDRMEHDEALALFDDLEFIETAEFGWKSVLARLTRRREQPTKWEGSPAHSASQLYTVGSWEWVVFLVTYRQRAAEWRRAA